MILMIAAPPLEPRLTIDPLEEVCVAEGNVYKNGICSMGEVNRIAKENFLAKLIDVRTVCTKLGGEISYDGFWEAEESIDIKMSEISCNVYKNNNNLIAQTSYNWVNGNWVKDFYYERYKSDAPE